MLSRIAWRISTVEALKGRTLVGDNVLDSEIGALDVAADGAVRTAQEAPFSTIYTDDAVLEGQIQPRGLYGSGRTKLTIEMGVTGAMAVRDDETGEQVLMEGLCATDRALEFFLDCVGRQTIDALTDPNNAWAELWRGLTTSIVRVERKRTSDAGSGSRIAAHQLVITGELLPDPPFGEVIQPASIWAKLLAHMESTRHPYLDQVRALLGAPTSGGLAHERQRRRFSMTIEEARSLGDMAVQAAEATEPDITAVILDGPGQN